MSNTRLPGVDDDPAGADPTPDDESRELVALADSIVQPPDARRRARRRSGLVTSTAGGARPRRSRWLVAIAACLAVFLTDAVRPDGTPVPAARAESDPPAAPAPVAQTGSLVIQTTPANARVILDGIERGVTPLTLTDVAAGRHALVLERHQGRIERAVRVQADQSTTVVESLVSGWVAIFSRIQLDIHLRGGRRLGSTEDGHLLLPPGRHELVLSNARLGFQTTHVAVVEPGAVTAHTVPTPTGAVRVEGPVGSEIQVDGTTLGVTPLAPVQVPIGSREFTARFRDGGERRQRVDVLVGGPTVVDLTAVPVARR